MHKPFLILFLLLISCSKSFASDNYPAGARSIALSDAFVSITDTWSTFHNQATLASLESFSAGVFYESRFLVDELSLTAGSLGFPINAGTFGFSFYQFGEGTFKEQKVALSFSKRLSEKINAGIQLDYFSSRFPENENAKGFATFECGVSFQITEYFALGAHVFNPVKNGIEMPHGKHKMPAIYRIGGHYQFSDMVLISTEAQKTTGYKVVMKTGLEFSPLKNLAFRFGISGRPVQCTAGIGYSFGKITTDIAFSYHNNLGFSPSVSLQFNL
ncbi:hypothetical protein OU798_08705 [Prolixibacteraceae bacterium Z1-6]|uniref:DUF3316 domain-containing protein n=1 Tax=Draconibacterium aestuarii TaxID=2998507 RepID=A0A9X3J5I4_9BACT|nr:hypothetical protein [Prolixibacteraceae bacterium Z1-6]